MQWFLSLLLFWSLAAAAQDPPLSGDGYQMIRTDLMWTQFLQNYIDDRCFRLCWERWLPMDIDFTEPGYYILYPKAHENWADILHLPSRRYCERLNYARAFQRCYISGCGGLFARVPDPSMGSQEAEKGKLWAWTSEYVARYGPGNASFEDYMFWPNDRTVWGPFPLGLTAACFDAPDEAFSPNLTDVKILKTKAITSTNGRFILPQAIRKLIIPIWTSPNLLEYWSYSLKSLVEVQDPRPLTDLRKKIIATYLFAFISYAHLFSISSKSKHYLSEAIQLLAFCLMPLLPLIQILHNLLDIIVHIFWTRHGWEWKYLLAGISGVVIYEEKNPHQPSFRARLLELDVTELETTTPEPRNGQWWFRLSGIAVNLAVLLFTIIPHFSRLNYPCQHSTFCAVTGFDHRVGWFATSALIPIAATLALHLLNKDWKVTPGAIRERRVEDWEVRCAVDLLGSTILLELLIIITDRVTILKAFNRLLGEGNIFWLAFMLGIPVGVGLTGNPLVTTNGLLSRALPWIFLLLAASYAVLVFLLQIFIDMEEYADLALDFVLPWNYRWQVPNPAWSEWWGL